VRLGELLGLGLLRFAADIDEACDQAAKEEKMERQLAALGERWAAVEWRMEPYKDSGVPLLKMAEEDFEALEGDQLVAQGMASSRYRAQFETEVAGWQKALGTINEVYVLLQAIQRAWSYLEPLFIGSEEVRRELPEDAFRFAAIDLDVRKVLLDAWATRNVRAGCCGVPDLLQHLEAVHARLEVCQKSLTDFLDGRRRQFPRYYFTSEADLLDILSNGSSPERVLVHTPKIYLATKTLVLSTMQQPAADGNEAATLTPSGRPYAVKFISDVGVEEVVFEPPVPLEGKVEVYMQTVLDGMKTTLFRCLERSLRRYQQLPRIDWLMHRDPATGRPADPAQIVLLALAINYVQEVEEAFERLASGADPRALEAQYERQVAQLSDLIRLTQSAGLSREDRQRVMVCITMDAHARDVVEKLCREKASHAGCFQWQAQLKHKYRLPPPHASFRGRDPHLRGEDGERAEVAICDAVLPYDYEYLVRPNINKMYHHLYNNGLTNPLPSP
jgi:dynein heavy chain